MICQSQVDMSVNILNPITTQVHQKYQNIRNPHSASYLAVSHKRMGAKSQIPKSLSISNMLKLVFAFEQLCNSNFDSFGQSFS